MCRRFWIWLSIVALVAGIARYYRLGEGVLRGDELNRYFEGRSPATLVEFWRDWQSTNQIPLQNVVCMGVARLMGEVNEYTLRVPGAALGILTVVILAFWIGRRWGAAVGFLAGMWLALNPYHLHESREAYYYGFLMFSSTLFSLYTLEALVRMRADRRAMSWWAFAGWSLTAWLLCMSHMSTWVYAAVWGTALFVQGLTTLPNDEKRRQLIRLSVSGLLILIAMRRWIGDAIAEVRKVGADMGYVYIGDRFSDVAPRVLPMYLAGFNGVGFLLLALVVIAAVMLWMRRKTTAADPRYSLLTGLTLVSGTALFMYIGGVGGGVAKETFFSSFWPVWMAWAAVTIWKAAQILVPNRISAAALDRWFIAGAAALFLILAMPAWTIMNLDGKPVPYRQIREVLDRELPPGTAVVVDRWFEPWNEMAIYPPSNVFVTFTIPDEPLRTYVDQNWRGTTIRAFETGAVQAFLQLTRNHEAQLGVWNWPDRFFKHKTEIVNPRALWLRNTGFSAMSGLYEQNTNRVIAHLYYNTDEDWAARARAAGRSAFWLYGGGWDHVKPWRMMPGWPEPLMQALWIQAGLFENGGKTVGRIQEIDRLPQEQAMRYLNQGRWADYRIAGEKSQLRLFNLTDADLVAELKLTGMALTGPIQAKVGETPVSFPGGLLSTHRISVTLKPGENAIPVAVPPGQVLIIRQVEI